MLFPEISIESAMNSILLSEKTLDNDRPVFLTIAIPTYKRAEFLLDAIDSVLSQENCDLSYEILVVNNDPSDNMEGIVCRYKGCRIRFYKNADNYGQVGNINQCVCLAEGEYISFLHDDDLLFPNYFRVIKRYLEKGTYNCILPEYVDFNRKYVFDYKHHFLNAITVCRNIWKKKIHMIKPDDYMNCFYNVYDAPTCGVVFKKTTLLQYGLFKDIHGAAWDYYNLRRLNKLFDIFILHECIGARRRYTGMTNTEKVQKEFRLDGESILLESPSSRFLKRFSCCIYSKKPLVKYIVYRISQDAYIYLNNLKRAQPISHRQFEWIKKTYTL